VKHPQPQAPRHSSCDPVTGSDPTCSWVGEGSEHKVYSRQYSRQGASGGHRLGHGLGRLSSSLLVAGWALAGAAQAQTFDSVVVFGDSLSDPGNVAALQNLVLPPGLRYPSGTNFSTNPDWVWSQWVEQFYGGPGAYQDPTSGGNNYAVGGSCVGSALGGPGSGCQTAIIRNQIDSYLLRDGQANPNSLYTIWGGANNLLVPVEAALGAGNPLDPSSYSTLSALSRQVAHDYYLDIEYLQGKGAQNIVIFNMPPIGSTPSILDSQLGQLLGSQGLSAVENLINQNAAVTFNDALNEHLESLDHGIIAVDTYKLFWEVKNAPDLYGLENTTDAACTGTAVPLLPFGDACGPAGSAYPYTYQPGSNQTYLFADDVHPSGATNKMLANVVISTVSAPVQVSLAGEGGLHMAKIHRDSITQGGSLSVPVPETKTHLWFDGGFASADRDDGLPTFGDNSANYRVFTLGATRDLSHGFSLGTAVTLGNHNNTVPMQDDVTGATLDSEAILWSAYGQWNYGPLELTGSLGLGSTDVTIERSIMLGPTERREKGSTTTKHFGATLGFDYMLPNGGNSFNHWVSGGLGWLSQNTDGYREEGNQATAMNFGKFSRDSLVLGVDYMVEFPRQFLGNSIRPYVRVGLEREMRTDPIRVSAGVNSIPGAGFSLDGFQPNADSVLLGTGVVAHLSSLIQGRLDYTLRKQGQSFRSHQFEVDLGLRF